MALCASGLFAEELKKIGAARLCQLLPYPPTQTRSPSKRPLPYTGHCSAVHFKKYKPSLRDSAGLVNALHMAHHAWRGGQEEKDVEKGISGAARAL